MNKALQRHAGISPGAMLPLEPAAAGKLFFGGQHIPGMTSCQS